MSSIHDLRHPCINMVIGFSSWRNGDIFVVSPLGKEPSTPAPHGHTLLARNPVHSFRVFLDSVFLDGCMLAMTETAGWPCVCARNSLPSEDALRNTRGHVRVGAVDRRKRVLEFLHKHGALAGPKIGQSRN